MRANFVQAGPCEHINDAGTSVRSGRPRQSSASAECGSLANSATAASLASLDAARGALTPRQLQIAELIASGLSNEQIARRLWLTHGTVANHVANILRQLHLQSRVQIATWITSRQQTNELGSVMALLDQLRNLSETSLGGALRHAANLLADVFVADKVDAMLCDTSTAMLVAVGTSATSMSERQRILGLDRLSLAHGGRAVWVYNTGRAFQDGSVELDTDELLAIRQDLGVRSSLIVPLEVNNRKRGVLLASSCEPEHFTDTQLRLLQFVAYWIGLVVRARSESSAPGQITQV